MARKYDERFDELTGLVKKVAGRVDEMQLEMRDMRKEISSLGTETNDSIRIETTQIRTELRSNMALSSSRFDRLESALKFVSGRQEDVIPKVVAIQKDVNRISEIQSEQTFKIIEMLNRLNVVEIQLRSVSDEVSGVNLEIKEVREAIHSFIDPIQIGWDLRENISAIEQRISDIERKLDN
jgi:chromosome segregation ATPase